MKNHRGDRENLIVDEIIEGVHTENIKIVGSIWRGVKGFYLESGKEEVLLISLYSCLSDRQKEKIKDEMLKMIEMKIRIKENLQNWIERRKEEHETNDNR